MLLPRSGQQRFIPINTQHASLRAHQFRNAGSYRARSTTHVEHAHAWLEKFRQPAMIPL